jgi:hypothetical protein
VQDFGAAVAGVQVSDVEQELSHFVAYDRVCAARGAAGPGGLLQARKICSSAINQCSVPR